MRVIPEFDWHCGKRRCTAQFALHARYAIAIIIQYFCFYTETARLNFTGKNWLNWTAKHKARYNIRATRN